MFTQWVDLGGYRFKNNVYKIVNLILNSDFFLTNVECNFIIKEPSSIFIYPLSVLHTDVYSL